MSLKSIGESIAGVLMLLALLAAAALLLALFLMGANWIGKQIMPWLWTISLVALAVVLAVLSPMSAFQRTRGPASVGLLISSYIFGVTVWFFGLLITVTVWGKIAAAIGLMMMGVGVVPIAMLAALLNAQWTVLGLLTGMLVLTFGIRAFAIWAAKSADDHATASRWTRGEFEPRDFYDR